LLSFIAISLTLFSLAYFSNITDSPILIASLGATTLLLFAAPLSPVSQPWAVLVGHVVSAIVGVLCFMFFQNSLVSLAAAVAFSILFMYLLNALHPPGSATAMGFILATPEVHLMGFEFVLSPVLSSTLLILVMAFILNNLIPGRHYPTNSYRSRISRSENWAVGKAVFEESDLDNALKEANIFVDISKTELNKIYQLAIKQANQRRLGEVYCKDIMSTTVVKFEFSSELQEVWRVLHVEKLKAAPIVDNFDRVIGIITVTDFMHHANLHESQKLESKMKQFLTRTHGHESEKHEVVGQIMTKSPVLVSESDHIVNLVSTFTEKNIHHLPVVDEKRKLTGMITRSDIMRAFALIRM